MRNTSANVNMLLGISAVFPRGFRLEKMRIDLIGDATARR
jgi:hypothetical protein